MPQDASINAWLADASTAQAPGFPSTSTKPATDGTDTDTVSAVLCLPDFYDITLTKVEGKEGTFKNTAKGPYFLLTDDGWRAFDEDPREYKWTDKTVCLYQGPPGDDDDENANGEGDGKGVSLDDACGRRLVRVETHRWAFVALPSGHSGPPAKSEDGGEKGVTDPPRVEEWQVETWGRYKAARDGFTEGVYRLTSPESQSQSLNVHSGDNPNVPYRFDSLLRDLSTRTENDLLPAAHGSRAVSSFCRKSTLIPRKRHAPSHLSNARWVPTGVANRTVPRLLPQARRR